MALAKSMALMDMLDEIATKYGVFTMPWGMVILMAWVRLLLDLCVISNDVVVCCVGGN